MLKSILLLLIALSVSDQLMAEQNLLSPQTRWVPWIFSGKEKITVHRSGGIFTQTHTCFNGSANWHTLDLPIKPGNYMLQAEIRTNGTAAQNGGAFLQVESKCNKKLKITAKQIPVTTDGKWELFELKFQLPKDIETIRIWAVQENFNGTTEFRHVKLYATEPATPYTALNKTFLNNVDHQVDLMPQKVYQLKLKGRDYITLLCSDQDGKVILSKKLASDDTVIIPANTMRSNIKSESTSGAHAVTIRLEEQPSAPESFQWIDWNSWNMHASVGPSAVRRTFEINEIPAFAIGRFYGFPEVRVNGTSLGRSAAGYNDKYYFNLQPFVKKGKNTLELIYDKQAQENPVLLIADVQLKFADGSTKVLVGSDGSWEHRTLNSTQWQPVRSYAPSWYNPELFDKPWVAPSALPDRLFSPWKSQAVANFARTNIAKGDKIKGDLSLTFQDMPYFTTNRFKIEFLNKDKKVIWHQWIFPENDLTKIKAGDNIHVSLDLDTRYLQPGSYELVLDRRLVTEKGNRIGKIALAPGIKETTPNVSINLNGLIDTFQINDAQLPIAIYYNMPYYNPQYARNVEDNFYQMSKTGYQIFNIVSFFGTDIVKSNFPERGTIWTGEKQYNFADLDRYMQELLSVNPDAYVIFFLVGDSPHWYVQKYPDERVVWDNGEAYNQPSWASKRWRNDTTAALRAVAEHIAKAPWSNRIIAWYMAGGYDGQWFQPMQYNAPFRFHDYSSHMISYFRNWLRNKYNDDVQQLRESWGNNTVDFATASIPTREERLGKAYYLDPVKERNVIDFSYCLAGMTNEIIEQYAKTIREGLGRHIPFGTYYIPVDTTYLNGQIQRPSDDTIYRSKRFHFAAEPTGYDRHGLHMEGTGRKRMQSLKLNQKLYIDEDDTRTFRSQPHNLRWGNPTSFGTLAGMKRNISQRLTRGGAHWYFDMYGHWFDSPSIQKLFRRELILMNELMNYQSLPELSSEAADIRRIGTSLHKRVNTHQDLHQVHFPVKNQTKPNFSMDMVNLSDLDKLAQKRYKLYVIDDCYALTKEDRQKINSLKKDNNILVFTHATGYSDDQTLSADHISSITNIKIEDPDPQNALASMNWKIAGNNGIFDSLTGNTVQEHKAKRFVVNDPEAVPLGYHLADNKVAAALKRFDRWTAIYLPSSCPSGQLLDKIGTAAKIHSYSSAPVNITTGGRLVCVYCPVDKIESTLALPKNSSVYEIFGQTRYDNTNNIPLKMQFGDTMLFFLGTPEEVNAFSESIKKQEFYK